MAAIARQLRMLDKMPGPARASWPVGNLGDIPKDTNRVKFMYQMQSWHEEFGPVYRLWLGPMPMVVVADPAVCRELLARDPKDFVKGLAYRTLQPWLGRSIILSEGERWAHKREVMSRAFRLSSLKTFVPCFQQCTDRLALKWRSLLAADGAAQVDMLDWMTRLTQDAIGLAAFGYDFHGVDSWPTLDDKAKLYSTIMEEMVERERSIVLQTLGNDWYLRTPSGRRFQTAIDGINAVCRSIVQRRLNGDKPEQPDLLDFMMSPEASDLNLQLDPEELVNEVHLFLFAGHETTSTTLTWALYLLQQNPDALARVREEIAAIKDLSKLTHNDANQLKYTLNVAKETLRLQSPTTAFVRTTVRDDVIGGYEVPANVPVLINSQAMHYDPKLWPDPHRFDPDRFTPENSKGRHPFAWAPFALGARNWYVLLRIHASRFFCSFTSSASDSRSLSWKSASSSPFSCLNSISNSCKNRPNISASCSVQSTLKLVSLFINNIHFISFHFIFFILYFSFHFSFHFHFIFFILIFYLCLMISLF